MGPIEWNSAYKIEFAKQIEQFENWWNNSTISKRYPDDKNVAFIAWLSCSKTNGLIELENQ